MAKKLQVSAANTGKYCWPYLDLLSVMNVERFNFVFAKQIDCDATPKEGKRLMNIRLHLMSHDN